MPEFPVDEHDHSLRGGHKIRGLNSQPGPTACLMLVFSYAFSHESAGNLPKGTVCRCGVGRLWVNGGFAPRVWVPKLSLQRADVLL
jgi:hypothetical protein